MKKLVLKQCQFEYLGGPLDPRPDPCSVEEKI